MPMGDDTIKMSFENMISDFNHEAVDTNHNIITLSLNGTVKLPKRFIPNSA